MAFKGQRGVVRQTKAIGRGPDRAGPSSSRYLLLFFFSLCFAFAGWRTPPGRGRGGGRRATDGPVTCGAHRPFSNCPPGSHPPTGRPRPRPGPFFGRQFVSRPFRDDVSLSLRERPMLLSSFFSLSPSPKEKRWMKIRARECGVEVRKSSVTPRLVEFVCGQGAVLMEICMPSGACL